MSEERKPAYTLWGVKRGNKRLLATLKTETPWGIVGKDNEGFDLPNGRPVCWSGISGAEAAAERHHGRVVRLVRKVPRGHSWSWACKRMLEGKAVARRDWRTQNHPHAKICRYAMQNGVVTYFPVDAPAPVDREDLLATDWEEVAE